MDEENEDNLEQARKHLQRASDAADRTIQNQVDSVVEGLDEERGGHRTQDDPGPKADRVAELTEKLEGLEDEAEGEAADHIAAARDHCREYLNGTDDGR